MTGIFVALLIVDAAAFAALLIAIAKRRATRPPRDVLTHHDADRVERVTSDSTGPG